MKILILVGAWLTASIFSQAQASDWSIAAELKEPSSIAIGFQESTAISRDGKTVLIAANAESCSAGNACGAIYVYVKVSSGWRRQAKLVASDAVAGLVLGGEGYDDNAIALSGDGNTAFVGSYPRFPGSGAVYIFVRKGGLWTEQQKLMVSSSIGFGRSVSVSNDGTTAVIGDTLSYFNFGPATIAHVFEKKGNQWQKTAELSGTRIGSYGNRISPFGRSVAISGDGGTVLIGSPGKPTDLQEAYIFRKKQGVWSEQATLIPADKYEGYFGGSVALSYFGNTAVVGDWNRGVAYVFQEDKIDRIWQQEAKLGDNITAHNFLGFSVDIDDRGENIVAGDWLAGTTFLFQHSRNLDRSKGHSRWIPKLLVSSGTYSASSVAISGDGGTIISSHYGSIACVLEDGSSNSCNVAYVLNRP
jgi:hypothetical protein